MPPPEPARPGAYAPDASRGAARVVPFTTPRTGVLAALSWAGVASTLHRVRRGEGALLAINFSLIAHHGASPAAQALVSVLAIGLMYAFNDLYDAPSDWDNPKKDRALIATYIDHRGTASVAILVLTLLTLAVSVLALGPIATAAVAGVMLVNVVYSVVLKGVPVVDVVWCGVWGALYAAIIGAPASLLVVVGLMTAVCHLYQALDDRASDAAVGITTTAVRSRALSANVLLALSLVLFAVLRTPLGPTAALTAFTPLLLFFVVRTPRNGWLLTKVYFGIMWLTLLGFAGAIG